MGHAGKAAGIGILYGLIFIAAPLGFINAVSQILISNGADPTDYFHNTGSYILVLGILLTVFASLTAYYEKGSAGRLAFGTIAAFFLILWGYFFIESMSIFYESDTYSYEVLVPGIAIILAISFSIRLFYRLVEFGVYRKEYLGMYIGPPGAIGMNGTYQPQPYATQPATGYAPEYPQYPQYGQQYGQEYDSQYSPQYPESSNQSGYATAPESRVQGDEKEEDDVKDYF